MSSKYDEFVARVKQNTMHETIYTDSEGRTIVVIVMEDLFSHFSLKERGGESKPTEAAYGMAPLKVEGGSYVPFPEKYTDVISDGGFDPRG